MIGDTHEPACHPGYRRFCQDLRDQYRCDAVVHIGDVVDHHAISVHAKHPEMPGPKDEYELALRGVQKWARAFPDAAVCVGNHDARVVRLAESVNIPARFLRPYAEAWDTPDWRWVEEVVIDGVLYFHGIGCGGVYPAANAMRHHLMSVAIGHVHSAGGIHWAANPHRRIFGLSVGCGVDERAMAFAYGKHSSRKAILSAAVVIDGIPSHQIMPCGAGEKYNRARFTRKGAA